MGKGGRQRHGGTIHTLERKLMPPLSSLGFVKLGFVKLGFVKFSVRILFIPKMLEWAEFQCSMEN